MEARLASVVLLALCYFSFGAGHFTKHGYQTENFTVTAPDNKFAKMVGDAAEKFRKELAAKWLGYELQTWRQPCPIQVVFKRHAEGRTSFTFRQTGGQSFPDHWDMMVAGSPERILDAVLPHEVTHTIFATHFGQPLPRWADEGACTTVEHISERQKNHRMLIEFLTTQRGIPFNKMFRMKNYPSDILPLYAQGYSLARYFIEQKGHQHFIKYLETGMASEDWDQATRKFYGHDNLSDLQLSWLDWIKQGCPKQEDEAAQLASDQDLRDRKQVAQINLNQEDTSETDSLLIAESQSEPQQVSQSEMVSATSSSSWYMRQMQKNGVEPSATQEKRFKAEATQYLPGSTKRMDDVRFLPAKKSLGSIAQPKLKPARPKVVCSGGTCKIIR